MCLTSYTLGGVHGTVVLSGLDETHKAIGRVKCGS